MTDAYLRLHRPVRSQFRSPRRKQPTGLTVIHTAESVMDTVGPDTGAEQVARFIRDRNTPGSYHDIVDSDSAIQLVRYSDEAFQDGTGSNPYALSISFACRAVDWSRMSPEKRASFLRQGAEAFARQQKWLADHGHPTTPLRKATRTQSEAGAAGFIAHGSRDPGRRSDPGAAFPWAEFFAACQHALNPDPTPDTSEDEMTPADWTKLSTMLDDKIRLVLRGQDRDGNPTGHDNLRDLAERLERIEAALGSGSDVPQ